MGQWPPEADDRAVMLVAVGFRYHEDTTCWMHWADHRVITAARVDAHDTSWLALWLTGTK